MSGDTTTIRHGLIMQESRSSAGAWDVALAIVGACAVAIGGVMLWHAAGWRTLDDDELQHLHFAWCIQRGLVPYRDFWDNHSPLLHQVLRYVVAFDGMPSAALLSARRLAVVTTLPAIPATYLLSRACFGRAAGWAAAGWMTCAPILLMKASEVRPDGLLLSCAAMSTWLYALAARRVFTGAQEGKAADDARGSGDVERFQPRSSLTKRFDARLSLMMFAAGIALGVGSVASTKSLIVFVAATSAWSAAVVLQERSRRRSNVSRGTMRRGVACGAGVAVLGFLVPIGAWLAFEAGFGDVAAAVRMTLLENFTYTQHFNPWPFIADTSPLALLSAAAMGGAIVIFRWRGAFRSCGVDGVNEIDAAAPVRDRPATVAGIFLVIAFVLMGAALGVMPAPYLQSALPSLPMAAALAGGGTAGLLQWACQSFSAPIRWIAATGVIVAFALFAVVRPTAQGASLATHDRGLLAGALITLDDLHVLTVGSDAVFDGRCAAVFRPHAYFHPALVQGVLTRYLRGEIHPSVREQLEKVPPACVLRDSRTSRLPKDDWTWIEAHYVSLPAPREWIMVPGWRIAQEQEVPQTGGASLPSGGLPPSVAEVVTAVDVLTPGRYVVVREDPRTTVRINGDVVGETIDLQRGSATITLHDPVRTVTLARIPGL